MSRDDNAMTQGLVAFLQGYGRNNREELSAIAKHESWPRLAALGARSTGTARASAPPLEASLLAAMVGRYRSQ